MFTSRKIEPLLSDVSSRLSDEEAMSKQRKDSFEKDGIRPTPNINASPDSLGVSMANSRASFLVSHSNKESYSGRPSVALTKTVSLGSRKSTLRTRGTGLVTESLSVPLNKMSLKLYGSKKAVQEEQKRLKRAGTWIIHPYSNFRLLWDCSTLILLLINITLIPVAITFWKIDQPSWLPFKVSLQNFKYVIVAYICYLPLVEADNFAKILFI